MTRLAVQQQQRLFREGLSAFLSRQAHLQVVGAVRTAGELVRLCDHRRPDVVLLELEVDEWDPFRLAAALSARHPELRLIGLPAGPEPGLTRRAQCSGIETVLSRSCGSDAVLAAIHGGNGMARVVPLKPRPQGGGDGGLPGLTVREREVLELIGSGATSKEMSAQLGISPKTVENYKQRIFAKLEVQNQAHAVALAMRRGLVFVDASMPAPLVS